MDSAFGKYLLLQVPGWILGAVVLVAVWNWAGLPAWIAVLVFILLVAKDFAIYPFVRSSFRVNHRTGMGQLIGARGTTREGLNPNGYVRVGGELWRAETEPGLPAVPAGGTVRVRKTRGLTLIVSAEETVPAPKKEAG
jgi:membrane protein implicated in regulation of membrane protease activity